MMCGSRRWPLRSGPIASAATARRTRPTVRLVPPDGIDVADIARMAEAAALARDLINTPSNDMGPEELAQAAQALATRFGAELQLHRRRRAREAEFSADPRRRHGLDARAAPDRSELGRSRSPQGDAGRQGRLLRHRRPRPETVQRHADHEKGHGRRRQRAGAGADGDGCQAESAAARADPRGRERGGRQRLPPARHLQVAQGTDGRNRQHRRRGTAGAGRRAGAGGRGEAGSAGRSRHPDGRGAGGAGTGFTALLHQ